MLGAILGVTRGESFSEWSRGAAGLCLLCALAAAFGSRGWISRATLSGLSVITGFFNLFFYLVNEQDWRDVVVFLYFLLWGLLGILAAIPPKGKLWGVQFTLAALLLAAGVTLILITLVSASPEEQKDTTRAAGIVWQLLLVIGSVVGVLVLLRLLRGPRP
jgi:hypothetical protein